MKEENNLIIPVTEKLISNLNNSSHVELLTFAMDIFLLGLENAILLEEGEQRELTVKTSHQTPVYNEIESAELEESPTDDIEPEFSEKVYEMLYGKTAHGEQLNVDENSSVILPQVKTIEEQITETIDEPKLEIDKELITETVDEPEQELELELKLKTEVEINEKPMTEIVIEEKVIVEPPQEFTADDWLDIMEGKTPSGSSSTENNMPENFAPAAVTGPHLKREIDFKEHHFVPERQAPRKEEKVEPARDGLKKREYFDSSKLQYKKSFSSSTKTPARICGSCGSKDKADKCINCEGSGARNMARLCEKCAGDKKTASNCVVCGRGNSKGIAKLCDRCAPRYRRNCYKCNTKL
jgi:hypothetical protein